MKHQLEPLRSEYPYASVVRSDGPTRVVVGDEDPEFVRRPVGFTAEIPPAASSTPEDEN